MNKIKNWYLKGINECDIFDKYIYLWICFNGYYYEYIGDENGLLKDSYKLFLNGKNDSEINQIKFLAENYKNEFENNFSLFKEYFDFLKKRGGVKDLRRGINRNIKYTEINNLESFLLVLYQVRCNLFHGGKNPKNINDTELIKKSVDVLNIFLSKIIEINNLNK